MTDWSDEVEARLEEELDGLNQRSMKSLHNDIRAALGEIERMEKKLQEWSDWEAMLHTQLERVVGGSGRGCDSLVETLRLRLLAREKEIDRKEQGYVAIIKMERDARDQFRERAEAAEAEVERLRRALAALMEGERGEVLEQHHSYLTCQGSDNADRGCPICVVRAALRGGGE